MATQNFAAAINDDGVDKSKLLDSSRDLMDLLFAVRARIALTRPKLRIVEIFDPQRLSPLRTRWHLFHGSCSAETLTSARMVERQPND